MPRIEITVKTRDLLYSYSNCSNNLIVAVHPKTIIPTLTDDSYYIIDEREEYEMTFRIKNISLERKKQRGNCHDYLHDCGCKTRAHCVDSCVKREISKVLNCTVWFSIINTSLNLTANEFFCPVNSQDSHYGLYVKKRKYCEDQCLPECNQISYVTRAKITFEQPENSCSSEDDIKCKATIRIMLSKLPSVIIEHMEEYPWENYIGAIGGHLGIWLGLSFITVIDLVLTVMEKGTQLYKINFPGVK